MNRMVSVLISDPKYYSDVWILTEFGSAGKVRDFYPQVKRIKVADKHCGLLLQNQKEPEFK